MWSGTIDNIPSGWGLCDGTQGTPDLRGRFVLAQNPYNGGSEVRGSSADGGYSDVNTGARLPSSLCHAIGMTGGEGLHATTWNEMPYHNHDVTVTGVMNICVDCGIPGGGQDGDYEPQFTGTAYGYTNYAGSSWPHNNVPPYYVLAFIMKL